MTQVYFRCSNPKEVLVDRCGAVVDDLAEARDHAACVVRSLTMGAASRIGAAGSCTSARPGPSQRQEAAVVIKIIAVLRSQLAMDARNLFFHDVGGPLVRDL